MWIPSNRRNFLRWSAALLPMFGTWAARGSRKTNGSAKTAALSEGSRAEEAFHRRVAAARLELESGVAKHVSNGDEKLGAVALYTKGLPHDARTGIADEAALALLLRAINTGRSELFENVPLGGYLKLADPQAAFAFDLIGPDCAQLTIPPPPSFHSAEQATELVEMYWRALLRDVPVDDYASNPLAARAAAELSDLAAFAGPRSDGRVTPALLFRGRTAGGAAGPFVSQFLLRDLPWTPIRVPQKIRTALPNHDFGTDDAHWLALQNGALADDIGFSDTPTYIRTGRDLSEYVHRDFTYQAFLGACLMLFKMSAPVDGGIPYHYSISQSGFVTFGPSDILHAVALVGNIALKSAWYQKWRVHMRLRPEELAGRVQKQLAGAATFPLHLDLLNSTALEQTRARFASALLPLAYPEGAPLHPSYPAGHAVVAGACCTLLKACFAESFVIPNPVVAAPDGQSLRPYKGADLTVGSELDKLAENIAFARDFAGVHWRSDGAAGLALGEQVAINILREMRITSHELFDGFQLTKFDGSRITIR